jgi:sortase A
MDARTRPDRLAHLSIDAWALCAEFTERIISEAQASAAKANPAGLVPQVDWEQIWRAGDGASSDEAAIGRIVQAAAAIAGTIAPRAPESRDLSRGPEAEAGPQAPVTSPPSSAQEYPAPAVEPVPATYAPSAKTSQVPNQSVSASSPDLVAADPAAAHATPEPAGSVPGPVEPEGVGDPITAPVMITTAPPADPATEVVQLPLVAPVVVEEPVGSEPSPKTLTLVRETEDQSVATDRAKRTRDGWATFFTWIRNLGVIMLLFVVWQLWGTGIAQHQAQSQLKSEFQADLRTHHPPKATGGSGQALIPAATRVPVPANGTVVAQLQIPSIGVDQYVVSGTDATQLSQGPGHYVGTAVPGQAGNVAIAGHRTTNGAPFNRLGQLVRGDRVILTTTSGEHLTYVISGTPTAVSPSDVAVLNYFGDNRITLTTCTPEFSAAQRLIAVGMLQSSASPKVPASSLTYHVVNPATASWDWALLPAVGIELCLLLLLGLSFRRFDSWFGKHAKWLILVPVWIVGLYLLFTSLTTFLPATY